jgi:wyosine [tRNA(Phe)-imidazoG37] synthetase (radical SAM superfamily)
VKLVEFDKKQFQTLYCLSPFVSIAVDINGEVSLCGCDDWQPSTIGNIFDHSLATLLSGDAAQKIRASIGDGSYIYCNERTCGIINNHQLNYKSSLPPDVLPLIEHSDQWIPPREIVLAGDLTCNLSCPSCRRNVIRLEDQQRQQQKDLGQKLAQNLFDQPHNRPVNLTVSTSGEVFASSFLLNFVSSIDTTQFPGLGLLLQTNGLLAPRNWHRLGSAADRVRQVTVTFDAARPDTYHRLRRGGTWHDLVNSLEFLQQQKQQTGMSLHTRMVVQQANWQEIEEFYEFSCKYQADRVEYVRITDWGTYGSDFAMQDVFDPRHPEHAAAQAMLNIVVKQPRVWLGGNLHAIK